MRNHLGSHEVVIVERPSHGRCPFLGTCLSDIMHQSRPAKPQIVTVATQIIQYFQCMIEIVFVTSSVPHFYHIQSCQFGENQLQESTAVQIHKSTAGSGSHQYLVQLFLDTLTADNLDSLCIALQRLKRFVLNPELQLSGKTDAT